MIAGGRADRCHAGRGPVGGVCGPERPCLADGGGRRVTPRWFNRCRSRRPSPRTRGRSSGRDCGGLAGCPQLRTVTAAGPRGGPVAGHADAGLTLRDSLATTGPGAGPSHCPRAGHRPPRRRLWRRPRGKPAGWRHAGAVDRPASNAPGGRTARLPPAGAAVAALEVERRAGVPAADDGRGRGALPAEPGGPAPRRPWPRPGRSSPVSLIVTARQSPSPGSAWAEDAPP